LSCHEPTKTRPDSGERFFLKGEAHDMDSNLEELKAHLIATDEAFRRLADQHTEYDRKLEALEAKPAPTEEEKVEEVRLKKLKLNLKDQMSDMMNRARAIA
jgi:uncharacterized protein